MNIQDIVEPVDPAYLIAVAEGMDKELSPANVKAYQALHEAAAEIERLRAENQTQADMLQGKDDAIAELRSRLAAAEKVVEACEAYRKTETMGDHAKLILALAAYREKHHKPTTTADQTASAAPRPRGGD